MARRRRIQGLAAVLGAALVAGCAAAFGPATPSEVARSLDDWRDLGLVCSGLTTDEMSGLHQWSCHGRVAVTFAEATIDGNDARVADFFVTVPAASQRVVAEAAFATIIEGADALAQVRVAMHAWLLAWDGAHASATFGPATVRLQLDPTSYSLGITH
jgi:hypothetical protein